MRVYLPAISNEPGMDLANRNAKPKCRKECTACTMTYVRLAPQQVSIHETTKHPFWKSSLAARFEILPSNGSGSGSVRAPPSQRSGCYYIPLVIYYTVSSTHDHRLAGRRQPALTKLNLQFNHRTQWFKKDVSYVQYHFYFHLWDCNFSFLIKVKTVTNFESWFEISLSNLENSCLEIWSFDILLLFKNPLMRISCRFRSPAAMGTPKLHGERKNGLTQVPSRKEARGHSLTHLFSSSLRNPRNTDQKSLRHGAWSDSNEDVKQVPINVDFYNPAKLLFLLTFPTKKTNKYDIFSFICLIRDPKLRVFLSV